MIKLDKKKQMIEHLYVLAFFTKLEKNKEKTGRGRKKSTRVKPMRLTTGNNMSGCFQRHDRR